MMNVLMMPESKAEHIASLGRDMDETNLCIVIFCIIGLFFVIVTASEKPKRSSPYPYMWAAIILSIGFGTSLFFGSHNALHIADPAQNVVDHYRMQSFRRKYPHLNPMSSSTKDIQHLRYYRHLQSQYRSEDDWSTSLKPERPRWWMWL